MASSRGFQQCSNCSVSRGVTSVTLLANVEVVIVSLMFSSWCIYFIEGVLSEVDKVTNALFRVNSICSMSAVILKQQ